MRKLLIVVALSGIIALMIQCKAFKSSHKKESAEMHIAKKRWPGITQMDLDSGRTLMMTKCAKCHAAKPVTLHTEEEWVKTLNVMVPKSRLNDYQRDLLTHYIFAARLALMN